MRRNWKADFRSFYYDEALVPADPVISIGSAALLIIYLHNTYLKAIRTRVEQSRWKWFDQRINPTVLPNTTKLLAHSRFNQIPVMYAKLPLWKKISAIDRTPIESLGLTNFSCPRNKWCSQIADEIAPKPSEIVVLKTTDSAVTGTNLRLIRNTMGHKTVICAGIFTDQYVSSTVEVS